MRSRGDRNDTLPPLSLPHVIENRDLSGRLHDATEAAEIWQGGGHATLAMATILRTVGATDGAAPGSDDGVREVDRRRLRSSWGRRPVLPTRAGGQLVLADFRGLQQSERILLEFSSAILLLRREGRNVSISRIHNHRRPPARPQV